MEIGEYGYKKSELIEVAEQIYDYKSKKQQLELQLAGEEFHEKYIPKREKMVKSRVIANLPVLFGLILLTAVCVATWVEYYQNYEENRASGPFGVALLGTGLLIIMISRLLFKLIVEESEMAVRLMYSKNPEKAMRFAQKYDINSFQDDRVRTEFKIADLKERILVYDNKIHNLELRQQEIIDEKKKQEEILKKHDIIKEDVPESKQSSFSFTLKEDDMNTADIQELNEYYNKEQDYVLYGMKDLQFKLAAADKEIRDIDEEMGMVKKRVFGFLFVFILAAFIQAFLPGVIGGIYGLVCLIVSLVTFFAIERACRGPIIRYLVENDSPYVAEYCFKNDVIPVKHKKQEIMILIKQQQDALDDIKRKKQALDKKLEG